MARKPASERARDLAARQQGGGWRATPDPFGFEAASLELLVEAVLVVLDEQEREIAELRKLVGGESDA